MKKVDCISHCNKIIKNKATNCQNSRFPTFIKNGRERVLFVLIVSKSYQKSLKLLWTIGTIHLKYLKEASYGFDSSICMWSRGPNVQFLLDYGPTGCQLRTEKEQMFSFCLASDRQGDDLDREGPNVQFLFGFRPTKG